MGRPPKSGDKAMAARLEIRVDPAEKAAYVAAALAAGVDLSEWIRATLNAAAKRKPHRPSRNGARKTEEE
jgi:predicted HicB family RNase H-like nuclease